MGRVMIYTDAGFKDGVGAWAVAAVREDGKGGIYEASGLLRAELDRPDLAEARAAANGLHQVIKGGLATPGDKAILFTDNQGVADRIRGGRKFKRRAKPDLAETLALIRYMAEAGSLSLSAQWVRGHSGIESQCPHERMNRRADLLCSRQLGIPRHRDAHGATDAQFLARSDAESRIYRLRTMGEIVARLTGRE